MKGVQFSEWTPTYLCSFYRFLGRATRDSQSSLSAGLRWIESDAVSYLHQKEQTWKVKGNLPDVGKRGLPLFPLVVRGQKPPLFFQVRTHLQVGSNLRIITLRQYHKPGQISFPYGHLTMRSYIHRFEAHKEETEWRKLDTKEYLHNKCQCMHNLSRVRSEDRVRGWGGKKRGGKRGLVL